MDPHIHLRVQKEGIANMIRKVEILVKEPRICVSLLAMLIECQSPLQYYDTGCTKISIWWRSRYRKDGLIKQFWKKICYTICTRIFGTRTYFKHKINMSNYQVLTNKTINGVVNHGLGDVIPLIMCQRIQFKIIFPVQYASITGIKRI